MGHPEDITLGDVPVDLNGDRDYASLSPLELRWLWKKEGPFLQEEARRNRDRWEEDKVEIPEGNTGY